MSVWNLTMRLFGKGDKGRVERILEESERQRTKAEEELNALCATLDGEDRWFRECFLTPKEGTQHKAK